MSATVAGMSKPSARSIPGEVVAAVHERVCWGGAESVRQVQRRANCSARFDVTVRAGAPVDDFRRRRFGYVPVMFQSDRRQRKIIGIGGGVDGRLCQGGSGKKKREENQTEPHEPRPFCLPSWRRLMSKEVARGGLCKVRRIEQRFEWSDSLGVPY